MAYCTLADLKLARPEADLINLTDDAATGSVVEARVTEAIAKADDLINGYLRGRMTVPLATVPALVRGLSVDVTMYYLYSRRKEIGLPESVVLAYDNAVSVLKDIARGLMVIDDTASYVNEGGPWMTNKTTSDKVFTNDVMDQF